MFDRFTDRARVVMGFARQEAVRLNHDHIGTEHILVGLVREGSGVAANVLENLEVDLERVRSEVEGMVKPGTDAATGQLPFTPRSKKVLDFAIEEAKVLDHDYVGTVHLLLGLLREKEGTAALVLMNLGLKLDDVRAEVMELLGVDDSEIEDGPPVALERMFTATDKSLRLSSEPDESLLREQDRLAAEIAKDRKHDRIVDEHILLALVKVKPVLFEQLLAGSSLTLDQFRQRIVENLREKFGDEGLVNE